MNKALALPAVALAAALSCAGCRPAADAATSQEKAPEAVRVTVLKPAPTTMQRTTT